MASPLPRTRLRRHMVPLVAVVTVLGGCAAQVPEAVVQSTTTIPAVVVETAPEPVQAVAARRTPATAPAPQPASEITTTHAPSPTAAPTTTMNPQNQTDVLAEAPPAPTPEIMAAVRVESSESPPYEISTTVPAVVLPDEETSTLINEAIDAAITAPILTFRSDMEDYFGGLTVDDVDLSTFRVDYDVTFVSGRLLSLQFSFINEIGGADVTTTQTSTMVFDLATAGVVSLTDVVGEDGMAVLASLVETEAVRSLYGGDVEAFAPYAGSIRPDYLGSFAVGPLGLLFAFNQFELGPDMMGAPTISIPYEAIRDLIDPDSAVGAMLG